MRIVFMGSPGYSIPVLEALLAARAEVAGVYCQPDKPAGRGRAPRAPALKTFAQERGIDVYQPMSLRQEAVRREIESLEPQVTVVAAYGKILPRHVLDIPEYGCVNIHPSLLPRHRGPSPVSTAVLQGDRVTGCTVMLMDEGMDSGPILASREVPIGPGDTTSSLTQALFRLGGELLVEVLPLWTGGKIAPLPQDDSRATSTRKLEKADGEARWDLSAEELHRMVRAYTPWPGLFTRWRGKLLKVLEAAALEAAGIEGAGEPGEVLATDAVGGLGVVAGRGVLRLERLQLEGKRPATVAEFMRGYPDFDGARLPS